MVRPSGGTTRNMPQFIPHSPATKPGTSLPLVRLTVRTDQGEQKYEFRQDAIVIGGISHADIPASDTTSLLAIASVVPGGLRFRQFDATQSVSFLKVKQELTLGPITIKLDFLADIPLSALRSTPASAPLPAGELSELKAQLERDRAEWESDAERQAESLAVRAREAQEKEKQLQAERQELEQLRATLSAAVPNVPADVQAVRTDLLKLRDSLYQQYRQRRDAVVAMREAVRNAASKVQDEKRLLRQEAAQQHETQTQLAVVQHQLTEERNELAKQAKLLEEWQQQLFADQTSQRSETEKLASLRQEHDQKTKELHDDLVRLQRQQDALDRREQSLTERDQALQRTEHYWSSELPRLHGLQNELEQRQQQISALITAQQSERAALDTDKQELERLQQQLERERQALHDRLQGCTDWERQLGQDRLRLDRLEAELAHRQEVLAREIKEQQFAESSWRERVAASEAEYASLRSEIESARLVLAERDTVEAALAARQASLDEAQAELEQRQQLLDHRLARVNHLRQKLHQRRHALQQQLQVVSHSESAHESLQEQLRRRMSVLTQRESEQQALETTYQARLQEVQSAEAALQAQQAAWHTQTQAERDALNSRRQALDEQALQLQRDRDTLNDLQEQLIAQRTQVEQDRRDAQSQRDAALGQQAELETARHQFAESLPVLLRSAETALERVMTVRSQLRTQLHEIHAYRQRCQDEITSKRAEVQSLVAQYEERHQVLSRLQDEQRLEAAALKQDVLHWQSQVQLLAGQWQASQSDISEKEERLASRARQLEQNQSRLELRTNELQDRERDINFRRSEVNKHLSDMQGWYRVKLRDMAEKKLPHSAEDADVELYDPPQILPLKSTRASSNEHLADLLSGMGLIDATTLNTLIEEAQKQRMSLRDCLLQNEFLTNFQMELIETGRVESLVLGPLRVIDRLRIGTMETIYRVFDPRLGDEALLRQLSASVDAHWKEEYQTLFSQAAQVQHPNVAGTFESLTMSGSPAVLQEWVVGLPGSEWQQIVTDASVALKLVVQLAAGLTALHHTGLVHGQLHPGRLLLTPAGELKICGAGEPRWLSGLSTTTEPSMADDIAAAIDIILPWCRGRKPSGAMQDFIKKLESKQIKSAEQLQTAAYAVLRSLPQEENAWKELMHFVQDRLGAGETPPLKKSA